MIQKAGKTRIGITRSRFNDLIKAKGRKSLAKKRFSKASLKKAIDDDEIVQSTLLDYSTKASEIELTQIDEPVWMSDYRRCCHLLTQVDTLMYDAKQEKAKKMIAVNDQKHRRIIQKLYTQAGSKIENCQKIIKGIEKNGQITSNPEQKKIFTNTIMALAMKTREKAKDIRQAQQQDLRERKQLNQFQVNRFNVEGLMNKDEDSGSLQLGQQGFQALEESLVNERNDEILKIVSSIHSLNTIYKQLQDVVIQQGSLLDRIDCNIDTTAHHVQKANEHLTKAQQHQRSPFANRVIFVLILLIVAFTLILAFR